MLLDLKLSGYKSLFLAVSPTTWLGLLMYFSKQGALQFKPASNVAVVVNKYDNRRPLSRCLYVPDARKQANFPPAIFFTPISPTGFAGRVKWPDKRRTVIYRHHNPKLPWLNPRCSIPAENNFCSFTCPQSFFHASVVIQIPRNHLSNQHVNSCFVFQLEHFGL